MGISAKILTFVVALVGFSSMVSADLHDYCSCTNGGSYNWRLTRAGCELYESQGQPWGHVEYVAESGNCEGVGDDTMGGNEWVEACRLAAEAGYQCADGKGTCYTTRDEVTANC